MLRLRTGSKRIRTYQNDTEATLKTTWHLLCQSVENFSDNIEDMDRDGISMHPLGIKLKH